MSPALLLWIILLLPYAGFLVLIASGKKANSFAGIVGFGFSLLGLVASYSLKLSGAQSISFPWFSLNQNYSLDFGFQVDILTLNMLMLVLFIAALVQLFSIEYMREDQGRFRYFAFLQLFVGAMLGIVLAANLLILYVFWELVGLSSYLLIGFWYTKREATQAAKKAFLVNRIGDLGLALGIFAVYHRFGTLDFTLFTTSVMESDRYLTGTGLLLFCGTVAKSAQFPLHVWLPNAMEGPTPVSALIHAATMVAAGVFLLARIYPILTPDALIVIGIIGTITMVMGAVYAVSQTDIKKTLAYSTISQLGLMVMAVGVGAPQAALFHLFTHAFFKAGLFLSAGSVIHALHHAGHGFDAQDTRLMGALRKQLPVTFVAYTICAAALSGLPLTSGFLSKDEIIHAGFQHGAGNWQLVFPIIALASAGLTAFYMTKQWRMVFFGHWRNEHVALEQIQEASWLQKGPLVIVALFSTVFVFSLNPLGEHVDIVTALSSISVATLGVGIAWVKYRSVQTIEEASPAGVFPTLDNVYNQLFVRPTLWLASASQWFDRVIVDGIVNQIARIQVIFAHVVGWFDQVFIDGIPGGIAWLAVFFGKYTRRIQGGQAQAYVIVAVLGLSALLIWWTW
ncbi:MAG: NADH-quinone oxidoreductase subunit L [Siphonobacter sp.]